MGEHKTTEKKGNIENHQTAFFSQWKCVVNGVLTGSQIVTLFNVNKNNGLL